MTNLFATLAFLVAADPVTLKDDATNFALDNGIVAAKVSKRNGDLVSLRYRGHELLSGGSGHAFAYWSHAPTAATANPSVTVDPTMNAGERAEVAVKAVANGQPVGSGPGGSSVVNVEIRYALARGDSAVYTYCVFTHRPEYPATSIGEARFAAKLNGKVFDHMTIDARRNKLMPRPEDWDGGTPLNMKEVRRLTTGRYAGQVEHKYDYSAVQFDTPAFGWSSTKDRVGLWFVNPSNEYLSGGPTKVELTGHLDNNAGGAPTLLNYWRGSHYGSSVCTFAKGEAWSKVVGPFALYCNADDSPDGLWKDALARAKRDAAAWPFAWVRCPEYPLADGRGGVRGRVVVNDPLAKAGPMLVGLAAPDYRGGRNNAVVDWQLDAKYYQHWTRTDADGAFTIRHARPGTYTLHAIADGVLGEFAKADITVFAGQSPDLGTLTWTPVRRGRPLWEIGVPDRTAGEFRHGDHYWRWGLYHDYAKEFPDDVTFTIGKSDWRTDWNVCQPPHGDGTSERGRETPWTVKFDLPAAVKGTATLRLAFAGNSARKIDVTVNEQAAGTTGPMPDTAVLRRDGIRGYWFEREIVFDAALLKSGPNALRLTVPAGGVMSGVLYDYLRLELKE